MIKGDIASLKNFSARLRELPRTLGIKIAAEAAPALTTVALATFAKGQDAFGVPWLPSAEGTDVTLRKSGALANGIRYVAIGTLLRVALATRYAKYQIGTRPIFPRQGDDLPPSYVTALRNAAERVFAREVHA